MPAASDLCAVKSNHFCFDCAVNLLANPLADIGSSNCAGSFTRWGISVDTVTLYSRSNRTFEKGCEFLISLI